MKSLNKLGVATLERVARSLSAHVVHEAKVNSLDLWEDYPKKGKVFLYDWQFGIVDHGDFEEDLGSERPTLCHAINYMLPLRKDVLDCDYRHLTPRFSHVGIYNQTASTFHIYRLTEGYEKVKEQIGAMENPEEDYENDGLTLNDAEYLITHSGKTRKGYGLE